MSKIFHCIHNALFRKEPLEQPTGMRRYELTIVRFTRTPPRMTNVFFSESTAAAWFGTPDDAEFFCEVSVHQDNFSLGDFILWCSKQYAVARIGEHRDHSASHPDSNLAKGLVMTFKDEDGSPFTVSSELVVPRELALEAMRAWLIDQKHPPVLRWN